MTLKWLKAIWLLLMTLFNLRLNQAENPTKWFGWRIQNERCFNNQCECTWLYWYKKTIYGTRTLSVEQEHYLCVWWLFWQIFLKINRYCLIRQILVWFAGQAKTFRTFLQYILIIRSLLIGSYRCYLPIMQSVKVIMD